MEKEIQLEELRAQIRRLEEKVSSNHMWRTASSWLRLAAGRGRFEIPVNLDFRHVGLFLAINWIDGYSLQG